jgi:hypothetical protein
MSLTFSEHGKQVYSAYKNNLGAPSGFSDGAWEHAIKTLNGLRANNGSTQDMYDMAGRMNKSVKGESTATQSQPEINPDTVRLLSLCAAIAIGFALRDASAAEIVTQSDSAFVDAVKASFEVMAEGTGQYVAQARDMLENSKIVTDLKANAGDSLSNIQAGVNNAAAGLGEFKAVALDKAQGLMAKLSPG